MRISKYSEIINKETQEYKPVHEWPDHWQQMIASVDVVEMFEKDNEGNNKHVGNIHKIKFIGRDKIIKMFGEHVEIKGFQQSNTNNVNITINNTDRLISGRNRARESLPQIDEGVLIGELVDSSDIDPQARLIDARNRENVMISSMFNVSFFLMYQHFFRYIKKIMISNTSIVSLILP